MKTQSKSSPTKGRRGCICKDGKYHKDCCDGSLQAQGIGNLNNQGTSNIVNTNTERTITNP